MNNSDRELITELQTQLDNIARIRRGLYNRKPGCACDENGLCAHHAEVYNRLQTVSDDLAKTIKAAQDER